MGWNLCMGETYFGDATLQLSTGKTSWRPPSAFKTSTDTFIVPPCDYPQKTWRWGPISHLNGWEESCGTLCSPIAYQCSAYTAIPQYTSYSSEHKATRWYISSVHAHCLGG